tara:strand:+ start:130 stop:726 length:597 start_codon:yes stop_codon:yes gene_type:complete
MALGLLAAKSIALGLRVGLKTRLLDRPRQRTHTRPDDATAKDFLPADKTDRSVHAYLGRDTLIRRSEMHSKTTLVGIMSVLALAVAPVTAKAEQLAGNQLKQFVNGKRVYLATPFGGEFPLNYQRTGVVTGDGTALGLGKFFAPTETGRWWVKGENLCQQWPTWYDGKTTCFQIRKTGERSLDWIRDDGRSGKARIEG